MAEIKGRLHVFWSNTYDQVPVTETAYSDDGGKTWKTLMHEETRGLDLGLLKVASDADGNIYLAMYGRRNGKKEKQKVYLMRSGDNGETWSKLLPMRHYPFARTKAVNPAIIAGDNGEVVMFWIDYRNIRANLYMQYSLDYGRTWQEKDVPLEEPGRSNTLHYQFTNSIARFKDRYYVLGYRFDNDFTVGNPRYVVIDFRLGSGGGK
jgi:Neuraminidase (sialidase)